MRAGLLRHRVYFYAMVSTRDEYGSSIDTWPIATISTRGEVIYRSGTFTLNQDEKFHTKSVELTVRYRPDIVETMRVQLNGTTDLYQITYKEIIGNNEGLRLTLEKLSDGLPTTVIDPPTSLVATLDVETNIILTWTNNEDDDAVSIERSEDGITYTTIHQTASGVTTYTDTYLDELTRYWYRIRAIHYAEYSAYAAIDDAITDVYVLPVIPTGLAVELITPTSVLIEWNDMDADAYQLWQSDTEEGTYTQVGGNIATTSYTHSIIEDTTHWYKVRGVRNVPFLYGEFSDAVAISIDWSSYWATHSPTDLVLTVMSDSIQLNWTDGTEAPDGYRVYLDGEAVDTVAHGVETYTITRLTVNTEYIVSLVGYSGTNESTALEDTVTTPVILDFADYEDGAIPVLTGATWAVSSGKAVNTPTEGSELTTDGGLESWASATNLTSWSEIQTASTTTNQETTTIHGGSNACRIDIDGAGSRGAIYQAPAIALNEFFTTRLWARASAASKALAIRHDGQISEEQIVYPDASNYTQHIRSGVRNVTAGWNLNLRTIGSASSSIYLDDVSLKALTKTTLFATTDAGRSDVQTKAYWNGEVMTWRGVIMNIDNVADPKNWVAFIANGSKNITYLLKSVNGTISQVTTVNTTGDTNSQLIELRKSGTTYQMFLGGVQLGTNQTISDASIISNTIHGLFSTYSGNTCDRFYCGDTGDVIEVPDGGTISDYYKYVSSGDTIALAPSGSYTFAASHNGFSTLPSGTSARRTTINGNGSTITGGAYGIIHTSKNFFTINDLNFADQTVDATNLTTCTYYTFNNVTGVSAGIGTYLDCFKHTHCSNFILNDCVAGPCTGAADTCDGFEDWDDEDVTYNNCTAIGFQNGAESYNNGHGFETYAQSAGEICKNITYNNCHAENCRVGFSCEGGPLSAAHENIRALNCTTTDCDLYDAGGVDGATLLVTAGTLTNRNGNVTDI